MPVLVYTIFVLYSSNTPFFEYANLDLLLVQLVSFFEIGGSFPTNELLITSLVLLYIYGFAVNGVYD